MLGSSGLSIQRRRLLSAAGASLPAAAAPALASLAAGCTFAPDADHEGEDAPRALALTRPVRMAWVLSSGGPRGFVHVGVLRALEELGLAPDLIVGASVGAIVGGLRAAGRNAIEIEALALSLNALSVAFAVQRPKAGRYFYRAEMGCTSRFGLPTKSCRGRPILYSGSAIISLSCAIQPTVRATANKAVNIETGMPMAL